jgi:hypothetical protein
MVFSIGARGIVRSGYSCETQLITTINNFLQEHDKGQQVDIAIFNIASQAIPLVNGIANGFTYRSILCRLAGPLIVTVIRLISCCLSAVMKTLQRPFSSKQLTITTLSGKPFAENQGNGAIAK